MTHRTSQRSEIDASVEAFTWPAASSERPPRSWAFSLDSQRNINNPEFAIKCNPLSTLDESCESRCLVATQSVFGVTDKSYRHDFATSASTCVLFVRSRSNYHTVCCYLWVRANHNTNNSQQKFHYPAVVG